MGEAFCCPQPIGNQLRLPPIPPNPTTHTHQSQLLVSAAVTAAWLHYSAAPLPAGVRARAAVCVHPWRGPGPAGCRVGHLQPTLQPEACAAAGVCTGLGGWIPGWAGGAMVVFATAVEAAGR